jgi:hypothetical protein
MRAQHIDRTGGNRAVTTYRGRWWAAALLVVCGLLSWGPTGLLVFAIVAVPEPPLLVACGFCAMIALPLAVVLPFQAWAEAVSRVELSPAGFSFMQPRRRGFVPLPPVRRIDGPWTGVRSIRRRSVNLQWGWVIPFGYDEYLISTDAGDVTLIETWRSPQATGRPSIPAAEIAGEVSRRSGVPVATAASIDRGGFTRAILAPPTPWADG